MIEQVIWEGVCDATGSFHTVVQLDKGKVCINQAGGGDYLDLVTLEPNEAIDIAFAILRELAPTIHKTLEKINAES